MAIHLLQLLKFIVSNQNVFSGVEENSLAEDCGRVQTLLQRIQAPLPGRSSFVENRLEDLERTQLDQKGEQATCQNDL